MMGSTAELTVRGRAAQMQGPLSLTELDQKLAVSFALMRRQAQDAREVVAILRKLFLRADLWGGFYSAARPVDKREKHCTPYL